MNFIKNRLIVLLTLFSIVILLQLATAETCESAGFMGRFQQNSNVTLTEVCPTCTYINITVSDPDSIVLFNNTPMTLSNGIFSFPPNSTISEKVGTYFVQGVSNLDNPFKSCYEVTDALRDINTGESIIYVGFCSVALLMFLFCVWGGIGLPARNRRNEINRVIGIEWMKYPKVGCMFLAYAFFVWFVNLLIILSTNFVGFMEFQAYFTMIFTVLMAGLYALFIGMLVIFFMLAAKDLKLRDLLTRGIQPR